MALTIRYRDRDGNPQTLTFEGPNAAERAEAFELELLRQRREILSSPSTISVKDKPARSS